MFKCKDCGRTYIDYEDMRLERYRLSDYMGGCYETSYYCWCGSSDIVECKECECCGGAAESYHDRIMCEDCVQHYFTLENLKCFLEVTPDCDEMRILIAELETEEYEDITEFYYDLSDDTQRKFSRFIAKDVG